MVPWHHGNHQKIFTQCSFSNQLNKKALKRTKGFGTWVEHKKWMIWGARIGASKVCSFCKFLHEIEIKFYCGNNKDIVGFIVFAVLWGNGDFNAIFTAFSKVSTKPINFTFIM